MDVSVVQKYPHTNLYINFQEVQGPLEPHRLQRMLPLSNKTEFTDEGEMIAEAMKPATWP